MGGSVEGRKWKCWKCVLEVWRWRGDVDFYILDWCAIDNMAIDNMRAFNVVECNI